MEDKARRASVDESFGDERDLMREQRASMCIVRARVRLVESTLDGLSGRSLGNRELGFSFSCRTDVRACKYVVAGEDGGRGMDWREANRVWEGFEGGEMVGDDIAMDMS